MPLDRRINTRSRNIIILLTHVTSTKLPLVDLNWLAQSTKVGLKFGHLLTRTLTWIVTCTTQV